VNGGGARDADSHLPLPAPPNTFPPFTLNSHLLAGGKARSRFSRRKVTLSRGQFTVSFTLFWRGRQILCPLPLVSNKYFPFFDFGPFPFASLRTFILFIHKWTRHHIQFIRE
jgi:hypothetical protein